MEKTVLSNLSISNPDIKGDITILRRGVISSFLFVLMIFVKFQKYSIFCRYFQSGSEEPPKVSQLRMLLEKKEDKPQVRRRVSFETVPESPKGKFSFVPISPVSPFVQPQRVLNR